MPKDWRTPAVEEPVSDDVIGDALLETLNYLRAHKPDDRSEKARRYAVTITEMEKVLAYFDYYVIRGQ